MATKLDSRVARLEGMRGGGRVGTHELDEHGTAWITIDYFAAGQRVSRVQLPDNGRGDGPKPSNGR